MINQEVTSTVSFMQLRSTTKDEFIASLTNLKEDKFAKTFVAKCNMMDDWDKCKGIWIDGKLAGAIVVTISKRKPVTANLQLLHTFHEFRGKGVARKLCEWAKTYAVEMKAEYFRVSAEFDAVPFYEKCGFKFICKQKTAKLAMFKLSDPETIDEYIWKTMKKKGKGGCVECYVEYKGVDFFQKV